MGGQAGAGGDTRASCPRRLVGLTQEHGQVEAVDGQLDFEQFPVGSILALIPYHVSVTPRVPSVPALCHGSVSPLSQACATAAMHPVYFVHAAGKVVELWRPVRGW